MLQISSDEEALDEDEEGNSAAEGNACGGEGNAAEEDGDQNTDNESNLRDVFDNPNDDGVTQAKILPKQRQKDKESVKRWKQGVVAGQYMAEAMNIPSSELLVGSWTESAKDFRRERHVS